MTTITVENVTALTSEIEDDITRLTEDSRADFLDRLADLSAQPVTDEIITQLQALLSDIEDAAQAEEDSRLESLADETWCYTEEIFDTADDDARTSYYEWHADEESAAAYEGQDWRGGQALDATTQAWAASLNQPYRLLGIIWEDGNEIRRVRDEAVFYADESKTLRREYIRIEGFLTDWAEEIVAYMTPAFGIEADEREAYKEDIVSASGVSPDHEIYKAVVSAVDDALGEVTHIEDEDEED